MSGELRMTPAATFELWTGLARVLVDQAHIAGSPREKQVATEMAAMATDFAQWVSDSTLRELVDQEAA